MLEMMFGRIVVWRFWQLLRQVYFRVVVALFVVCGVVFLAYSILGVVVFLDAASWAERLFGLVILGMAITYGYFALQLAKARIQAIA